MKTDNELIAEFMGYPKQMGNWRVEGKQSMHFKIDKLWVDDQMLKFHESWDWLMPACKKWDYIDFSQFTEKVKKQYIELCDRLDDTVSCYEIIPTFKQLVENIKWYNQQKP